MLSLGQHFSNCGDVLCHGPAGGVDHEMCTIPRMIFPPNHLFPSRQLQSRNVSGSRFHAASMFVDVGARYLDFNRPDPGAARYSGPRLASQMKRIH